MVSLPKIIGSISFGVILCLSLSDGIQAAERPKSDPCAERIGGETNPVKCDRESPQGIHIVNGEVLHINGANLLVKQSDGEEVIFHIDLSTQTSGRVRPGDHIEADVNEVEGEKHVLSIRPAP
jgi:hypothetical protein